MRKVWRPGTTPRCTPSIAAPGRPGGATEERGVPSGPTRRCPGARPYPFPARDLQTSCPRVALARRVSTPVEPGQVQPEPIQGGPVDRAVPVAPERPGVGVTRVVLAQALEVQNPIDRTQN